MPCYSHGIREISACVSAEVGKKVKASVRVFDDQYVIRRTKAKLQAALDELLFPDLAQPISVAYEFATSVTCRTANVDENVPLLRQRILT